MPTALFSLFDKSGSEEFAIQLHNLGWDFLASGGTAQALRNAGLPVQDISDYTGSPEILSGRVKTLHAAIHAGILARSTPQDYGDLERVSGRFIDLVVVNLYPFEDVIARSGVTIQQAIENIDIGGVALIRAAAKNFERVTVVTEPSDYPVILKELREGKLQLETRRRQAAKAFQLTTRYDRAISNYLFEDQLAESARNPALEARLYPISSLRYGENPHQEAVLYSWESGAGPLGGQVLQGKALSYNNLLDLDAAWRAVVMFTHPAVVIVKHLSPCGIACGETLASAFPLALASDPISAFGGVIAVNRIFDKETAQALGDLFVECIIAPGFTQDAMIRLSARKNLRLVSMPDLSIQPLYELRSINQGVLRQQIDGGDPPGTRWKVVSSRGPTEEEWKSLRFAWIACQHVKSNAIVFAQGEATVGIGGGQPNRVDCVRIAASRAGELSKGAVMASDAFFPFPDSVEEAIVAGVTAIIAPGGSVRDNEAIAAADAAGVALVFTGVRHFRH